MSLIDIKGEIAELYDYILETKTDISIFQAFVLNQKYYKIIIILVCIPAIQVSKC